jgi:protein-L-isoaspartate(D-aspartate) O-methyltransferase
LRAAFASVPRERFLGPGPWKCFTPTGYVETPGDDPVLVYQDITVAISIDPPINNGQPSLHALCIASLNPKEGETVLHIGAGTGYYTAILAQLIGPAGQVHAYEIDPGLARKAAANLAEYPNATVHARSGVEGNLPICDCIYVNAGVTDPPDAWFNALRAGGRLLFPLTGDEGYGGMLVVARTHGPVYAARFVTPAAFIHCVGAREGETAKNLSRAFQGDTLRRVQSLQRHTPPDESCWCAGRGWWLSTRPAA